MKKNQNQNFGLFSAHFRFQAEGKKVTSQAELKNLQLELWLEPARLGLITTIYQLWMDQIKYLIKLKGHENEKFYFLENISTHLFVIKIVISLVKVPFFKRQNRGVHSSAKS